MGLCTLLSRLFVTYKVILGEMKRAKIEKDTGSSRFKNAQYHKYNL